MTEKPVAALIRENEFLREVASKAIRLRRIGQSLDTLQTAQEELDRETHGIISRSGTGIAMYEQAFATAMDDFDKAVMNAAEAGMDWTKNWREDLK